MACSHAPSSSGAAPTPEAAPAPRHAQRSPRSPDPEVAKLRRSLEFGKLEECRALLPCLDRLGPEFAAERALLQARFAALSGNNIEAIRAIETVRKEHPLDASVYATAAEVYAAAGKLDAGWDEVRAGETAAGASPELARARGVLWILRSGGAKRGLEHLEAARKEDPGLPFTDRALSQAHLLVAKEFAGARKAQDALLHAKQAVEFDPDDVDARRLLSDVLILNGDFEGGVAEIRRLVDRGEPLTSELALLEKKAGIGALLDHDRPRAVLHFAAARKLGLTDMELSTGARILDEEAAARFDRGVEAYKSGDLAAAKTEFRAALEVDPDRIEAKNSLAVVLFKEEDYAGAIELWRAVIDTARKESLVLPEPVHVNLAQALRLGGDPAGARAVLEGYLAREPEGRWKAETLAALAALPAKETGN